MVGTTDDPCDDLAAHRQLAAEGFATKVLPSFRPDKVCIIQNKQAFIDYLRRLEACQQHSHNRYFFLLDALQQRVNYFHENGCRDIRSWFSAIAFTLCQLSAAAEKEFTDFISSKDSKPFSEPEAFFGFILLQLCPHVPRERLGTAISPWVPCVITIAGCCVCWVQIQV